MVTAATPPPSSPPSHHYLHPTTTSPPPTTAVAAVAIATSPPHHQSQIYPIYTTLDLQPHPHYPNLSHHLQHPLITAPHHYLKSGGKGRIKNHVTSIAPSVVQSGGTVETSFAPNEETCAHQETIYGNLVDQVAQVNMVNCNMRETNVELKSELARYKIQEQRVFVPQTTKSNEESFLSNVSNMVTVSKTISIPNEDLSDDTTPSVAQKFLNEVKNSLVTLQCVVKQKMTLEVHNWSSSAHKEIQFLQEASKFVSDFKSLAKEADESIDKQKSLELKIERILKESVSHDIMSIVQNGFVDVPSDLQTELDRRKEKLELCIIKKEKEYAVKLLQAQLRDLKGKSSDTLNASNTLDPTSVTPQVDKPKLIDVTLYSKKLHALIPSHSVPQPREFNVLKHCNVIAPGMFKIDPSQTSRVDLMPNNQSSASSRTNPITNFQRHVTFKENVSSDMVNASSTWLVHTARTRRLQPKGNSRNARVPSASKSSEVKKNVTLSLQFGMINLKLSMFLGTVRFRNDNIAAILGYGDLKWENITITK
nr:hypothetical protein [Tanacetum cinerariifolium]